MRSNGVPRVLSHTSFRNKPSGTPAHFCDGFTYLFTFVFEQSPKSKTLGARVALYKSVLTSLICSTTIQLNEDNPVIQQMDKIKVGQASATSFRRTWLRNLNIALVITLPAITCAMMLSTWKGFKYQDVDQNVWDFFLNNPRSDLTFWIVVYVGAIITCLSLSYLKSRREVYFYISFNENGLQLFDIRRPDRIKRTIPYTSIRTIDAANFPNGCLLYYSHFAEPIPPRVLLLSSERSPDENVKILGLLKERCRKAKVLERVS